MLIHRIAAQLYTAEGLRVIEGALDDGKDATLAVSQSGRTLILAAQFARHPRPTVYIVSGEDAADRAARALAAYVGLEHVARYPERTDHPWRDTQPNDAVVAARCAALGRIAQGEPCIMVASARALLRCVPPRESHYWKQLRLAVGEEVPFEDIPRRLVGMGYTNAGAVDTPGLFRVHGDSVDVFPAQSTAPVRIEFFGDEIDRIRRMVVSTGQTIGDEDGIEIFPCRELALTDDAVRRIKAALYQPAQNDTELAALLELVDARIATPELDRYLPLLYESTVSPLAHVSNDASVVLSEPRSLFDDCTRAYEDLERRAGEAKVARLDGLFVRPQQLDFGHQQRLNFVSLIRAGGAVTAELKIEQPAIAGSDTRFISRVKEVTANRFACVFAAPDRGARESLELSFTDESIPFEESLTQAPENAGVVGDADVQVTLLKRDVDRLNARPIVDASPSSGADGNVGRTQDTSVSQRSHIAVPTLTRGRVTFVDAPIASGVVVPEAHLAVFSIADLNARMDARRGHHARRRVDVTEVTFPFKPGDYVVHATHGIAHFTDIVRQEVGGKERDYFLLEYADGDKLYVPLEQVDRITRYVGPDGENPRLTRLNTADWSRATKKARKSAKKLAFDLVDLYTRRSSITGFACPPDTPEQIEMEESFPYEPTRDQLEAINDIKADMEAPKPMDRLLCGDVGFGKTEVALRAAFKCVDSGRQVMVLCPTTILAQQHYETFFERFAPFGVEVEVLSRFRTPAQQKRALAAFAEGKLDVLVGTHRLLSSDVNPANLGLVIIDEEQRFGVQHKEQLKNLREQIDVLTLSATPIPRTMQMAISGVRDMSLITTPPTGRRPVAVHVGEYDPDVVSAAIRLELGRGGQVYYVSNRVKTIDDAVDRVHEAVPEARVAVAHGKMSPREVEDVMVQFATGKVDVLVATTIIESGIDNPHTNTLIIEDSQRLGLAQLYQLKGRVGRSATQAYAYFMFPGEIPLTPEATERLTALSEFQDLGSGMRIAMRDLEIRGAGSLVGAEQHGNLSSVGFDLFTQMLGQAVAEARGDAGADVEESGVTINLPADFYLDEEYLPAVDKRVLVYRKLAAAEDLAQVDEAQEELEQTAGALPLAAQNLFDRARIRIRGGRLGLESVALTGGRLVFQGVDVPKKVAFDLRDRLGAVHFPKTRKLSIPYKAGAGGGSGVGRGLNANDERGPVAAALMVLEQLGASGDDD
ncbi:transcription-repair coupling factor [Collinsella sp. An2]|uniref:transcription-repair coupling factor n=1 Tax=Collinsella sp. An2 TaxID=1965585 RepID=UPI000B36B175|nr:transcription-repair coupling factor [Collinsella sp. An2]OUP10904.1 transcription-repair coupling factor [Collinsella sp. An2]